MTPKPTSDAERAVLRFVLVTMDRHIAGAVARAQSLIEADLPDVRIHLHTASDWSSNPESLEACKRDIARGDIIVANMLFLEDHVQAILPALQARREDCDAMIGCIASGEIIKLTRLGGFRMDGEAKGPLALLKRLRGAKKKDGRAGPGKQQMAMLRRLPKILRFIPGTAQDVRAYFLTLQYWLAGSDENIANMVRYLAGRYATGPRSAIRRAPTPAMPKHYPDVGLYHPRLPHRVSDSTEEVLALAPATATRGTVGLLVMRSYVLANDTDHYDAVIERFEAKGYRVLPAFAAGLDSREAISSYLCVDGKRRIDALVSLTGFSLVGGPAFNDAPAAEEILAELDVPYVGAQAIEFQTLEQWSQSTRGLLPVEATIMVAIPELDGATQPIVYAGRAASPGPSGTKGAGRPRAMVPIPDRVEALVDRVTAMVELRRTRRAERRIAIVLFNFPPNAGATGTAAFLSVFESLHNILRRLASEGYTVEVPETVDDLRAEVLGGNAQEHGADAHVYTRIPTDDHVCREPHLTEIERQWGPAPGRAQADGRGIHVLGRRFGEVFVGIQPGFGYEGDPMRLLFEGGFAPTHAFSAFYRFLREDFAAHAVLHLGTHGALEFMPGKQAGLSSQCWPDRLIGHLPNFYVYAANNPSEGTIAKRRSGATLLSYMTPPLARAGLYEELSSLEGSVARYLGLPPGDDEAARLVELIQRQAAEVDLAEASPPWPEARWEAEVARLHGALTEVKASLIPDSLHVLGRPPSPEQVKEHLQATAQVVFEGDVDAASVDRIAAGEAVDAVIGGRAMDRAPLVALADMRAALLEDAELPGVMAALDGRFIRPAPGGDLLRNPHVLPTGRNIHGFDPFRIPSRFAVEDGRLQAERILARHAEDGHGLPKSVAIVLWGTDNLKTEGGPIGQALALLGARPRFDGYGRLCGAELVPLEELGRPRIDVTVTLSGIFRDLLPLQTKLLAEASYLAASADEPPEDNFVRAHVLEYLAAHPDQDLETAALRVFSNADGTYGSNVNQLVDSGAWDDEDELAETFSRRKCFAYGRSGEPTKRPELFESVLARVELTYQNLESVELGVTTIDHYFDTLGGIGRAVRRARGGEGEVPVYIGDQTSNTGMVRSLAEQVNLESRTRMLNPKWYEGMLEHGPEGVRQIEAHITNTMGWSATTGQVAPWVYKQLSHTFVLDPEMRERLAALNPKASAKLVNRLIEAHERSYWTPDGETLEALQQAGEELEDRLEGLGETVAA